MRFGLDLAPQHKVFGGFAIYSFTMGNIFPRFAEIRNAMGVEEGAFRPVHPLAAYFSMLAPMVVYLAGAPIRRQLSARHLVGDPPLTDAAFVQHIQDTMRRALGPDVDGDTRTGR